MKRISHLFLISLMLLICCTGSAQKQSFDVISFAVPKGWQQKQNEGSVQLTATDNATGAYVMAIITKASPSTASASENFTNQWTKAIKGLIKLDGEPVMQTPSNENGWDILTGSSGYTDNGTSGNVALLSATCKGQTMSVIVMLNSKQFQNDLSAFLNSLELSKAVQQSEAEAANPASGANANPSSIVGLWVNYQVETSGYSNGFPILTAGYFRKEYLFNQDGTYVFRTKNWSTTVKEILFVYETGTWKISGNQLTIAPSRGRGEWWSKAANGRTVGWGSRIKAADVKLEKVTYSFELHYYSGVNETHLLLQNARATERDGSSNSGNQTNNWSYSPRKKDNSLIDNPPGFKTGTGNQSGPATKTKNTVNSPLGGK